MPADHLDELEKLHALKEKGALTEQEFQQAKSALLSGKQADEMFCTSCGKIIRREAEICVHCGVRVQALPGSQTTESQPSDRRAWIRDGGRAFHHYSPWVMAGLSFFTFGIYTFFWLNHWHGVMPKRRHDDPSTAKANWFLLIPLYGIYWMFVSLLRVCTRLDEELADAGIQERVPKELVRWFLILNLMPYLSVLTSPILGFIATFQMQSIVNRLARLDEEYYASRSDASTVTG